MFTVFKGGKIYDLFIEILIQCTVVFLLDYLYRVESYHAGTRGSAKSAWIATRSGQGGKIKLSHLTVKNQKEKPPSSHL